MNLRLDDLQFAGLKIYQDPKGYCFSSDSVLLANYVHFSPGSKVAEFCSGTGVISILLTKKQRPKVVYGFEVLKECADIFKKSVEFNHLENKVVVYNEKLEDAPRILGVGSTDVVVCNPPYFPLEGVIENPTQKQIATAEIATSLESVVSTAKQLLKFGGKLFMVHRVDRLVDVLTTLRKYGIEPKQLSIIYPAEGYEPVVFLVEAMSGGKKGLRVSKVIYACEMNKANLDKPAN